MRTIEEITSVLTEDQKQVLKDVINEGGWGDCNMTMLNEEGKETDTYVWGYITDYAKNAGHFNGRQVSSLLNQVYKKLCPVGGWWLDGEAEYRREDFVFKKNMTGEEVSHYNKWVEHQSYLFVRGNRVEEWEEWARS